MFKWSTWLGEAGLGDCVVELKELESHNISNVGVKLVGTVGKGTINSNLNNVSGTAGWSRRSAG